MMIKRIIKINNHLVKKGDAMRLSESRGIIVFFFFYRNNFVMVSIFRGPSTTKLSGEDLSSLR